MAIISRQNLPTESVIAQEKETQSIKQIERLLKLEGSHPKLVGTNGEEIVIPDSVYQVLRQVVHAMALGQAISIVPQEQELTTQQAAEFLNVSRPYLIKLLEQGEIPYATVGTHRRVRFRDLRKYKEQRDAKRHQLLQELVDMSEETGLYEYDE
ncbi:MULTISPECIES: helix-turn-helix domain-containing protein [unclassified Nostoc]|uniref:helix-turn-helix domain-containing protein n=1 Tax=unclassified Nostoc TaxID=2593658 RepID=UPI002AD294F0|nr:MULTISPECIES: helix-turn-helix domain-containing protein [unclassified Nostoc]MDZ8126876.1 helix-turn-helix domain-containing protein [Nostoc sp. CmiVER01]MDZ8222801.1 helix-turn-helix domain-containing protein [Nostoc sp. ChiVER01]